MSLQFEDHTALREFERMLDQSFGTYDEDLKKITKEEERNESNFEEKKDIFLVDWQSTADPAKPLNWGRKKWINVGIVSFITFLSYVNVYYRWYCEVLIEYTAHWPLQCSLRVFHHL